MDVVMRDNRDCFIKGVWMGVEKNEHLATDVLRERK